MRSMVGLLLAAVVTGDLVAGVLPMHAPEAQAITVRHRTHSSDDGGVSARDRAELKLAATMIVKSRKGGTKKGNRSMALNYKNLDRYDKGKTIMRRQLAAAWLAGGGSLYNVSTAERRRVNVYRKQPGGRCSACVRADSADRLPTAPPSSGRCTGRSDKHYAYSGIPLIPTAVISTMNYNSCETDRLILYHGWTSSVLALAALGMASSGVGFVPAMLVEVGSTLYSMRKDEIEYQQSRSRWNATYWIIQYSLYTRIYPQN